MMRWIGVAAGGALGAAARWSVAWAAAGLSSFPWPTLGVNAAGAFALGYAFGQTDERARRSPAYQAIAAGFLGAFTTMSAFGLETWTLLEDGRIATAAAYAAASAVVGPLLAAAGRALGDGGLRRRVRDKPQANGEASE